MTLTDFPQFQKQIRGYIRRSIINDTDFEDLIAQFERIELSQTESHFNLPEWLYYKADLFLLKYYQRQKPIKRNDPVAFKIKELHHRIARLYRDFWEETEPQRLNFSNAKVNYPFFKIKKLFRAIVEGNYPHQILVFCYRTLLDGWNLQTQSADWGIAIKKWNAETIITCLSAKNLELITTNFINEYARQANLPYFLVNLYLLPLKEKLNMYLKEIILNKDHTTAIKLQDYLEKITGDTCLNIYYRKDKAHDISDWCNKVRTTAFRNLN